MHRTNKQIIKMNTKKYSQHEINSNIERLTNILDKYVLDRKEINKNILSVKKQIKVWEEFDENQYKMF